MLFWKHFYKFGANKDKGNEENSLNFDIFMSYSLRDSIHAIKRKEIDAPPSYDESVMETNVDPREIANFLKTFYICSLEEWKL